MADLTTSDNAHPAEHESDTQENTFTPTDESAEKSAPDISKPPSPSASTDSKANQSSSDSKQTAKDDTTDDDVGTLELYIRDGRGDPIQNLEFRVLDIGPIRRPTLTPEVRKEVFRGKTDSTGRAPQITGIKIGTRFEIQVKKSDGEYKLAAIGPMDARDISACLKSPKVRFEFSTFSHQGNPGSAEKRKQEIVKSHNQTPEPTANISRNPDLRPTISDDRDKNGNPKIIVKDGLPNMYGQNSTHTPISHVGKSDLEKVKALIEFGTKQASWKHVEETSAAIIEKMKRGTYKIVENKDESKSEKRCARYVKIALWKAGYSHVDGDLAPTVSPARNLGPALEAAGFKNITQQIPDGRWAAPGDVIVYINTLDPNADGHVDIRTYDGYISDFIGSRLPVQRYKVIGIYRKYFDPLPEQRMLAFLRTIQSRETKGIPENKAWYALNTPIEGSKFATSFATHPWDNQPLPDSIRKKTSSTAAGAYQIVLGTWIECVEKFKVPRNFTPKTQQIVATIKLEQRGALPHIRQGNIEAAVSALRSEWVSLPGGRQSSDTMEKFMEDYNKFLSEIQEGKTT